MKHTFASRTFAARTSACGTFRGLGVTVGDRAIRLAEATIHLLGNEAVAIAFRFQPPPRSSFTPMSYGQCFSLSGEAGQSAILVDASAGKHNIGGTASQHILGTTHE